MQWLNIFFLSIVIESVEGFSKVFVKLFHEWILKICLVFRKSEPHNANKLYACKNVICLEIMFKDWPLLID